MISSVTFRIPEPYNKKERLEKTVVSNPLHACPQALDVYQSSLHRNIEITHNSTLHLAECSMRSILIAVERSRQK